MSLYYDPYGLWSVSTEGDCEGKSVINLGSYKGYVDEIALYLADHCYYSLTFKRQEEVKEYKPTRDSVSVVFDIKSKLWDEPNRHVLVARAFKDRPVVVNKGQFFASVLVSIKDEKIRNDIKIENEIGKKKPEELNKQELKYLLGKQA